MTSTPYKFVRCPTKFHGGINIAHRPCYRCGMSINHKPNPRVEGWDETLTQPPIERPGQLDLDSLRQMELAI